MDRDVLRGLLEEGVSLAEIGREHGLHESTVGYWVGKHGLKAARQERHAAKGPLDRDELETLVQAGLSTRQIADRLHRSQATIRYWLKRHGLEALARPGKRSRSDAERARAAGMTHALLICQRHGETKHLRDARGSFRCTRCRAEAVVRRRRKVKQILVAEAGGRCRLCGYDRCIAALEFHHIDPEAKDFGLARCGAHRIERLRAEAAKCVLLCSNCHAEVEAGLIEVS
jgi:transposase